MQDYSSLVFGMYQTRESWVGLEPTNGGFANRSVNPFATRTDFLFESVATLAH